MSRILIAAAEVPSHQHRMDGQGDVSLSCLTTDGAAVGLLEAGGQGAEVLSCMSASDGSRYQDYWCEFPASRHFEGGGVRRGKRITKEHIKEGRHFPIADFAAMRATAEAKLPGLLDRALDEASLKTVDVVLVAHLDPVTEDALALSLGSECGRVIHSDLLYGVGASLLLALARETEAGRIGAGESVALLTAGSGASWGVAVLRTS
jgi:3-oxoacyl-[acyl-carrier-protein] synthase III